MCSIELKPAQRLHNAAAFPLLFTRAEQPPSFHVLTNVDRNALYPTYPLTDALMTAVLEKLRKQFSKEQWGLLVFDKQEMRQRTTAPSRAHYEAYGAELLALAFSAAQRLPAHGSLSCAAAVQFYRVSASQLVAERLGTDLVSVVSDGVSGRVELLAMSKFLVLSKFPVAIESATSSPEATELYQKTKKKFGQLVSELGVRLSRAAVAVYLTFRPRNWGLL